MIANFAARYDLMTSGQAPTSLIAAWLCEPLFAAYVRKRRSRR